MTDNKKSKPKLRRESEPMVVGAFVLIWFFVCLFGSIAYGLSKFLF